MKSKRLTWEDVLEVLHEHNEKAGNDIVSTLPDIGEPLQVGSKAYAECITPFIDLLAHKYDYKLQSTSLIDGLSFEDEGDLDLETSDLVLDDLDVVGTITFVDEDNVMQTHNLVWVEVMRGFFMLGIEFDVV